MQSRVFIPQVVVRYDPKVCAKVPMFDFSAAAQYGALTPILAPTDNPMFLARITPKIREALADFGPNDYFIAAGDPAVIAICCGLILRRQQKFNLLKWDRKLSIYINMEVNP